MLVGYRDRIPTGSGYGDRARQGARRGRGLTLGIGAFIDDEGGYTTVAMAVALLASFSLVFAAASAQWVASRSAEVQEVADAAASAGANAVAAYSTVAQTIDACVLSMGLTGMVVCGAGFVASCVPALAPAGAQLVASGQSILDARRSFSRSAGEGLQRLEGLLPAIVVANSASCVLANGGGGISYAGCAVPFPQESRSDFSAIQADVDDAYADELAQDMRSLAEQERQAKQRADAARERGWRADCGNDPSYCLYQRAATLAGLTGTPNPYYGSIGDWNFGAPLSRAREYYAARSAACAVEGSDGEQLTDAACRAAFYEFALGRVWEGSYSEAADGSVSIDLPSLPRNAAQARETSLYTDARWPCTAEGDGRVLHSSLACPGAQGPEAGSASLAELEAGAAAPCAECGMDIGEMGRVAAASTSIENGFEHWWQEVVEASRDYQEARNAEVAAKKRLKEKAGEGADMFKRAIEALTVARPKLCPPGAYGCVGIAVRGAGTAVPGELTAAFLSSAELPAGAAVSAAVLAPDPSTAENNVLASFFDGLSASGSLAGGVADGVMTLWGKLLVGYGSAYGSVAETAGGFLDGLDGVLGGSVGSWLKGELGKIMQASGLAPVDMRLRKPVLVNTADVLSKAGYDNAQTVRSLIDELPDSGDAADYARAFAGWALDTYGDEDFTVAELTVPVIGTKIPLKVNLKKLAGAL